MSSVTNFALLIAVARTSTPRDFGYFTIAYAGLTLGVALQRSAIGVPLGLDLPNARLSVVDKAWTIRRSLGLSLGVGILLAGGILLGAVFAGLGSSLGLGLVCLAGATPLTLMQDTLRYVAIALSRPGAAFTSDVVWLSIVGLAIPFGGQRLPSGTSLPPSLFWGLGAAVALCVAVMCIRPGMPSFRGARQMLRDDPRRLHLALDSGLGSMASLMLVTFTAVLVSPAATAALRGSSTAFGPVSILISVVSLAVTPVLSRRGVSNGLRFVTSYCVGLAIFIVVWTGALLLIPDSTGASLLGATWTQARTIFLIAAVELIFVCGWSWSVAFLRVAEQTKRALNLRVLHVGLYLGGAAIAGALFSTAAAVMGAMAIAGLVTALVSIRAAREVIRKAAGHS